MFLLAFYGFFRIGELAAKSAGRHCSLLQFKDLTFLMSNGTPHMINLTITDFKHNTSRKPFEILIEREAAMPFLSTSRRETGPAVLPSEPRA